RIGRQHRQQDVDGCDVHEQEAHQRDADHDRNHIDDAACDIEMHDLLSSSLLPLWEKVARTKSAPDEGSLSADSDSPNEGYASAERDPSPGTIALRAIVPPSPTRGEGKGTLTASSRSARSRRTSSWAAQSP